MRKTLGCFTSLVLLPKMLGKSLLQPVDSRLNNMREIPVTTANGTSLRNLLFFGFKQAVLGSIWGSLLFLLLFFVVLFGPLFIQNLEQLSFEDLKHSLTAISGFYLYGFLITLVVTFLPAILSGICISWISSLMASAKKLTTRRSIAIGVLIGCLFCLIPVGVGLQFSKLLSSNYHLSNEPIIPNMIEITITGFLTAAIVGSWHSLKMYRYLATPS